MLLSILGILVLIGGYYQFIFKPQYTDLKMMESRLSALQKQIKDIEQYTDPNGPIQKRYKESQEEVAAASSKYFPELIQERQIRIVDQMLTTSVLNGEVLTFTEALPSSVLEKTPPIDSEPTLPEGKTFLLQELVDQANAATSEAEASGSAAAPAFTGNGVVQKMETKVEFIGSYPQIINFIKAVETYPQKILIDSIDIESAATENLASAELKGSINLLFYGVPKMDAEQDHGYKTWDIYGVYGRMNPYMP